MNQLYTAIYYGLKLGDRLIRQKGILSKHHGIYVGIHNGIPLVAENQSGQGVQYVSLFQFLLGNSSNLIRIEKFKGTEEVRRQIIPRINKLKGTQYDLINFNCEHFAELIQTGRPSSKQVDNVLFGLGLITFIGLIAAISE
ncbi:MAG: lecithin retinol acyltransferase family protein [Bacteroidales bacterium]|nr:lecithin retinol acyltransferase family protein [Bacteroidales bacterium]